MNWYSVESTFYSCYFSKKKRSTPF